MSFLVTATRENKNLLPADQAAALLVLCTPIKLHYCLQWQMQGKRFDFNILNVWFNPKCSQNRTSSSICSKLHFISSLLWSCFPGQKCGNSDIYPWFGFNFPAGNRSQPFPLGHPLTDGSRHFTPLQKPEHTKSFPSGAEAAPKKERKTSPSVTNILWLINLEPETTTP